MKRKTETFGLRITISRNMIKQHPKHIKCVLVSLITIRFIFIPQVHLPGREMTQSLVMINKSHLRKKEGKRKEVLEGPLEIRRNRYLTGYSY